MKKIAYIENFEEWDSSFQFSHRIKVRFSETDMFGHMNNTVPFTYFEEARIEYFNSLRFMQDWVREEIDAIPVVADLQCDFLSQMYFGDVLTIYVKAMKVGRSSVDIHYMGKKQDGSVCLAGRGAIVQIARGTGKPLPWSEDMRQLMEEDKHADQPS